MGLVSVPVTRHVLLDLGDDLGGLVLEDALGGGGGLARDRLDLGVLECGSGEEDGDAVDESESGEGGSVAAGGAEVLDEGEGGDEDSGSDDEVSEGEAADFEGGFAGVAITFELQALSHIPITNVALLERRIRYYTGDRDAWRIPIVQMRLWF